MLETTSGCWEKRDPSPTERGIAPPRRFGPRFPLTYPAKQRILGLAESQPNCLDYPPPTSGRASCEPARVTSTGRTKTVVTNATAVIKVMARHDRLGFMVQRSYAPPQNAFGGIDRGVEAARANQVRNRSSVAVRRDILTLRATPPPSMGVAPDGFHVFSTRFIPTERGRFDAVRIEISHDGLDTFRTGDVLDDATLDRNMDDFLHLRILPTAFDY